MERLAVAVGRLHLSTWTSESSAVDRQCSFLTVSWRAQPVDEITPVVSKSWTRC